MKQGAAGAGAARGARGMARKMAKQVGTEGGALVLGRKPGRGSDRARPPVPRPAWALGALWASLAGVTGGVPGIGLAGEEPIPTLPEIRIFSAGETRQTQGLDRADLDKARPGANPLAALGRLPGVDFQGADAQGAYEWSVRFNLRGFGQNYLGFTLDDVPLGDMSYTNNNGLHIGRAISAENLDQVLLSQGSGDVGTAATGNLGGTVRFLSRDPDMKPGAYLAQTLGSDNFHRTFARLETGKLESGTLAYLSFSQEGTDKWKGQGRQGQDQFNAKLVHGFGDHLLTLFYDHSQRREVDYADLSLSSVQRLGWHWDNYAPDWSRAVAAAQGQYSGGVTSGNDAYYQASGLRNDDLAAAALDLGLGPSTRWKTTLYTHHDDGQGHWYSPPSLTNPLSLVEPLALRLMDYRVERAGLVTALTWQSGVHTVNGGLWVEHSRHYTAMSFQAVSGPVSWDSFLSNPTATVFQQQYVTDTRQFHLQDTLSLLGDRLHLNLGFKTPRVRIEAANLVGPLASGRLTASKSFLPALGASYRLAPGQEVFASYTENMRAYQPGVTGPFAQLQPVYDLSVDRLRPETSATYEVGYRYRGGPVQASLAAYHVDFHDRLLSVATCAGVVGCPATLVNVGRVSSDGLEGALSWNPVKHWTWFNALTLDNSRYRSNYREGTALVQADGKQVVATPRRMWSTELTYEPGPWYARLGGKYTDRRYYSYTNDAAVPSFWLWNLSAGYRPGKIGPLTETSLQLGVSNLFDKRYFSTVGTNGFVTADPNGQFATLLEGAPRQVFVGFIGRL